MKTRILQTALLIGLTFLLTLGSFDILIGQTTVFSDDFSTNQNTSWTTSGAIGSSAWSVLRSGTDWGGRRNTSPAQLELTNDVGSTGNANGWVLASTSMSSFSSPYNTTLQNNTGLVTWTFNMRQIRSNPAGFAAGDYGVAFILAGQSTTNNSTGNGYAVVLGQSTTTDPVRLITYTGGFLGTLSNLITSNTTGLTDFGTEYLSVKVTYSPYSNTWELFLRNDGSLFSDPASGTLTSQGTFVNSTHTATSLTLMGGWWQGSTTANQTAFFDNTKVTVTVTPSITVNPTSLAFGYVPSGGTSSEMTYSLSGTNLSPASGNITITPPSNFEVSLTSGGGFSASPITKSYSGGALASTTIYVVFKPTAPNTSYSGNITNSGGGATTQNMAVSGTSPCDAVSTFPWTEGFENGGTIPSCWANEYVTGTQNWAFQAGGQSGNPSAAHTGSYNAFLFNASTTANVTKLVTPALNISGLTNPQLKFWHTQALWPSDQDELRVYYKTSSGGSWVLLQAWTNNITAWTQETLTLPSPSSTYYIAFEGTAKYGYGVCVDDVMVESSVTPTITVVPTSLAFGYVPSGGTSTEMTYSLSGTNLSPASGNITITPPPNFEVSFNSGSGFSASPITKSYSGGALAATTIYVRFKPTAPSTNYSGNITNAGGGATTQNVAVSGTSILTYCSSNGNTTFQTSVTLVNINTINNSTGKPAGYNDYTSITTSLEQNSIYNLTVNVNTDGNYTIYAFAWIDWNQDGDFVDTGESFDLGTATNTANGPTSASPKSITIPLTATLGTTRMRVSAKYGSAPAPCETNFDGEVEDYSLNINPVSVSCDYNVPYSGNNTIITSSGYICDHGGTSNYDNNASGYTVINPVSSGNSVKLTFTHFSTESGWDFVKVYDGIGTSGTLLLNQSGTSLPSPVTSPTGSFTIQFTSDGSNVSTGFRAAISNVVTPTVYNSQTNQLYTTIQEAINAFGGSVTGGAQYVEIRSSNTYNESVSISSITTSATNTLTVKAQTGQTPIINGGALGSSVKLTNTNYVTLQYLTLTGATATNDNYGIWVGNTSAGPCNYLSIQECKIYGNGSTGIQFSYYGGSNVTVSNCLIRNNGGDALQVYNSSAGLSNLQIINNTIYNNNTNATNWGGIVLIPYSTSYPITNSTIKNNIIQVNGNSTYDACFVFGRTGYGTYPTYVTFIECNYNNLYFTTGYYIGWINFNTSSYTTLSAWQTATGLDANSISSDPLFVNASSSDFHLQSIYGAATGNVWPPSANPTGWSNSGSNSPSIDAGNPSSTYSNESTCNGGRINQGCYGNTVQASKSDPTLCCAPPAITGQPSSSGITYGDPASFTVTASNETSYQWEEYNNTSWNPLSNGGIYSNVTTTTLNISQPTCAMNGYKYRCVVSGACSPAATSDGLATLTVTPKVLYVTASSGQFKYKTQSDPVFTYTALGFVSPENESVLTGTLSRVSGEAEGFYGITIGSLAGANYSISFTPADFEIKAAYVLNITGYLQGNYSGSGLMNTNLRTAGQLPNNQPFNTAPWNYVGDEELPPTLSPDVVDWVLVELRSNTTTTLEKRAGLLYKDGSVRVSFSGSSAQGDYIVLWHRNHMPVMSAGKVSLPISGTSFNLSASGNLYGTNPAFNLGDGKYAMIAGDVTHNGLLHYSGPGNDRGAIIAKIAEIVGSGTTINSIVTGGYWFADVNLNNELRYIGPNDDRSIIFSNLTALTGSSQTNAVYYSAVPGFGSKDQSSNDGPFNIQISEYNQNLSFEIITSEPVVNGMVDNIQFTLAWKAADTEIAEKLNSFTSDYMLAPQGDAVEVDGVMHRVYVSVIPTDLPEIFNEGDPVTVMSVPNNTGQNLTGRLWIADNDFTAENNAMYYVSVWGNDFTGMILGPATGMEEIPEMESVELYPNPVTKGEVNVAMNLVKAQEVTILVTDMQGKLISSNTIMATAGLSSTTLDLDGLFSGVYFVRISGDNLNTVEKLIVK